MRLGTHRVSLPGLLLAAVPPIIAGTALIYLETEYPQVVTTYQPIFAPLAGLVSAVAALTAAVVVASFTAEVNTRNIKVKAAWDALAKKQWDKDYLKAREIYLRLVEKNTAFSKYAVATGVFDDDFSQEFEAVMNIANDYEIMAIGIEKHVLDESVIQASFRTAWINDYNKLAPFFNSVRDQSGNDRYFCQFEKVTRRWSRSKPPK